MKNFLGMAKCSCLPFSGHNKFQLEFKKKSKGKKERSLHLDQNQELQNSKDKKTVLKQVGKGEYIQRIDNCTEKGLFNSQSQKMVKYHLPNARKK